MGQRISIGVLGQLGASLQRKPLLADHDPFAEGPSATHSRPQPVNGPCERQKWRWSEFPSGWPGEWVRQGHGEILPGRQAEGQEGPSPVPAKRRCSLPAAERWVSEDGLPFHVHQEDGIQICDRFLLGQCRQGESCPLHHTPYPFHWQVTQSRTAAWHSLSDSSQRHLEKIYCDAQNSRVQLMDGNRLVGFLDQHTKELSYLDVVSRARRLGSTSDWKQNPRFHTRWKVYWKDGDKWRPYEEPVPRGLLAALESGSGEPTWQFQGQLYTMDLRPPQPSPEDPGSVCPIQIQRRPVYRSLSCMARYLGTIPTGCRGVLYPATATIPGESPTDGYQGPYPATWVPQPPLGQPFLPAEVAPSEAVYRRIFELFHASVPEDTVLVQRIYRIRNDALWERYRSQKARMSRGCSAQENRLLERHLFHGTSAENVALICRVNFDPSLSGKHGAHYGRGCYFSSQADYAHSFALASHPGRCRYMFLAKVLVGRSAVGRRDYTRPPETKPGGVRYDSCSDGAPEPDVYVIFNSSQSYPYFVICYKLLCDPVMLDCVSGAQNT